MRRDDSTPAPNRAKPGSRKGVMERCPNCGTPGRTGAKFCTSCGFRFPGDQSDIDVTDNTENPSEPIVDDTSSMDVTESTFGWPSPPAPQEPIPTTWDQPAASSETAPADAADEPAEIETLSNAWPIETVDAWPARPDPDAADPAPVDPDIEVVTIAQAVESENPEAEHSENVETVAQALRLLEELRDTIAGIGSSSAVDLSGVISELEVAVTPPGAMAPDDVAELREALLAARERPRDLDTIVDLTQRIDAMVALVIAYDRTIAAIERSLEALRGGRVAG